MNNNHFISYQRTDTPPITSPEYLQVYNTFNLSAQTQQQSISDIASGLVGQKYSWKGSSPSTGFDDIGLINYAYQRVGVDLPKNKEDLKKTTIPVNDIRVGDIIWGKDKVKLVSKINNGQIYTIQSQGKRYGVTEEPLDTSQDFEVRRVARASGNYIINYFMDKGLTENQARGIYGNIMQESGGNINATSQDGHNSFGLAQWTGDRKQKLFQMYGRQPSVKQQLDFLWWELNNTERGALNALLQTNSIYDATKVFMNKFERPNPKYANLERRLRYANS